ncbi:MAG: DUF4878 domain-containing protein [Spirochaetaceae bacterium]|jgi:hypothetical protein|nr:DUF4878 domain-containing protein [Spirochaetaceae bacterium]
MKLITVFSMGALLVLMACGGGGSPEDAINDFIGAIKAGDGEKAASYLSEHALSQMDEYLAGIKEDPEGALGYFESMGIETTAGEIENWTSADLYAALISSPGMVADLGDKLDLEITGSEIRDSEAKVYFTTVDGEEKDFEMVLENGEWKLWDMPN